MFPHRMSHPLPVVSVVIVNFNSGTWLVRCVESVLGNTVPIEVIVVDNGSKDGSMVALDRLRMDNPHLRLYYNRVNLGFATAVNRGMRQASAPFILLLNPDCLLRPDTLSTMLAAMDKHPGAGMAGCLILNEDGTEQRGCRRRIPTPTTALGRILGGRSPGKGFDLTGTPLPAIPTGIEAISGAFMLVRAEAVQVVGGLDEGYFMHCEDLDWCLRFAQAGYQVLFVPGVAITHKKGVCSDTTPIRVEWYKHQGMARFYRKHVRGLSRTAAPAVYLGIYVHFAIKALAMHTKSQLNTCNKTNARLG